MKKRIAIMAFVMALSAHSMAQNEEKLIQFRKGVFYTLTPEIAKELGLNIPTIRTQLLAKEGDKILVRVNEQDELDLAVHEDPAMNLIIQDHLGSL